MIKTNEVYEQGCTAAMQLGYRVEEGAFEDSATPEKLREIEKGIEQSRTENNP
jgi:hypothetical protein